jgi:hypothetical protein
LDQFSTEIGEKTSEITLNGFIESENTGFSHLYSSEEQKEKLFFASFEA